MQECHRQERDLRQSQPHLKEDRLKCWKLGTETYQRSNYSVLGYSTVVTNGIDDPGRNPDEPEGCGHLGVKESGSDEHDQEDRDPLEGVLVDSLKTEGRAIDKETVSPDLIAVEDLLGVAVHGGVLHLVELPGPAHHHPLPEGEDPGEDHHQQDVAEGGSVDHERLHVWGEAVGEWYEEEGAG